MIFFKTHLLGQFVFSHATYSLESPAQRPPPNSDVGQVLVLFCIPLLHVLLQDDQDDQGVQAPLTLIKNDKPYFTCLSFLS